MLIPFAILVLAATSAVSAAVTLPPKLLSESELDRIEMVHKPANFNDALADCRSRNLFIVTPKTGPKNIQLYHLMAKNNMTCMWLGANRRYSKSDAKPWVWVYEGIEGTVAEKTFWGPREPNNWQNQGERCIQMCVGDKYDEVQNWRDIPCHLHVPYMCESY